MVDGVKVGELVSGRRSKPINLATKPGVLVPGELLVSEEKSLRAPPAFDDDDLDPPFVLI